MCDAPRTHTAFFYVLGCYSCGPYGQLYAGNTFRRGAVEPFYILQILKRPDACVDFHEFYSMFRPLGRPCICLNISNQSRYSKAFTECSGLNHNHHISTFIQCFINKNKKIIYSCHSADVDAVHVYCICTGLWNSRVQFHTRETFLLELRLDRTIC